jgi:hypothetical protein
MSSAGKESAGPREKPSSVATALTFPGSPEEIWNRLVFYEQIPYPPPLYLRLLLPAPHRAEGRGSEVGDEIRCVYEKGHLVKRLIRVDRSRYCRFDVVEQGLAFGRGIRLTGGSYTLRLLPDGSTRVELETRYLSPRRPAWFWKPIEASVCHAFHRHILGAMRRGGSASDLARRIPRPSRARNARPGIGEGTIVAARIAGKESSRESSEV